MLTFLDSLTSFVAIPILVLAENHNEEAGVEVLGAVGQPRGERRDVSINFAYGLRGSFGCNAWNVFSKASLGEMRFERKKCEMNEEKTAVWPLQCGRAGRGAQMRHRRVGTAEPTPSSQSHAIPPSSFFRARDHRFVPIRA